MKIAIIAIILALLALVVSAYVTNRKQPTKSVETPYWDDTPQENRTDINLDTGAVKKYLPVKKYKMISFYTEDRLNEISKDGWKLITVDGGIAYFEKEVMEWVENKGVVFEVR